MERVGSPERRHDGKGCGKGEVHGEELEMHDSVMHACGGRRDVAHEIRLLVDEALEAGVLAATRGRCAEFLGPLEDADGERDGRDRGTHRFLKAVTVMLRLKGFNSRDRMMPIREIDLTGQPLFAFVLPARPGGAPGGRLEPVVRALEMAVHLARSSNHVAAMRLAECELTADGGEKCITEVARLVRQVGIGREARFLEQVDLRGNELDAESVRKIVEAAVKERCERPSACRGAPPLWLDLSGNRVRNPQSVFHNLQAWAGWAHGKDAALCMADNEGCSKTSCATGSMLHMPRFLEQSKGEKTAGVRIGTSSAVSASASAIATTAPPPRPVPRPRAWRDVEDLPRSTALVRQHEHPLARRGRAATGREAKKAKSRSRSRRRRRRDGRKCEVSASEAGPAARVVLRPGPGRRRAGDGRGSVEKGGCERSQVRRRRCGSASGSADQVDVGGEGLSASGSSASDACPGEKDEEGSLFDDASAQDGQGSCSASQSPGGGGSNASASPSPLPSADHIAHSAPNEDLEIRMNRLLSRLRGVAANGERRARGAAAADQEEAKARAARSHSRRRRRDRQPR